MKKNWNQLSLAERKEYIKNQYKCGGTKLSIKDIQHSYAAGGHLYAMGTPENEEQPKTGFWNKALNFYLDTHPIIGPIRALKRKSSDSVSSIQEPVVDRSWVTNMKGIEKELRDNYQLDSSNVNFNNLWVDDVIAQDRNDNLADLYKTYPTAIANNIDAVPLKPKSAVYRAHPENGKAFYDALQAREYNDKQAAALMALSYFETKPRKDREPNDFVWSPNKKQYGTKDTSAVINSGLFSFEHNTAYGKKGNYTYENYMNWLKENNLKDGYDSQIDYYVNHYLNDSQRAVFNDPDSSVEDLIRMLHKAQKSKSKDDSDFIQAANVLYDRILQSKNK